MGHKIDILDEWIFQVDLANFRPRVHRPNRGWRNSSEVTIHLIIRQTKLIGTGCYRITAKLLWDARQLRNMFDICDHSDEHDT